MSILTRPRLKQTRFSNLEVAAVEHAFRIVWQAMWQQYSPPAQSATAVADDIGAENARPSQPGTAVFVEAKLLARSRGLWQYCEHGLNRFVTGDYAWATDTAMLLGYRHGSTLALPAALAAYLTKPERAQKYQLQHGPIRSFAPGPQLQPTPGARHSTPQPQPTPKASHTTPMYLTTHHRTRYFRHLGSTLGNIDIHHLWLDI